MLTPTEKIWHNGQFIAWDDAKIHVLSHVVSYGSSVFEGIRCYETSSGPAAFRLREHRCGPRKRTRQVIHLIRLEMEFYPKRNLPGGVRRNHCGPAPRCLVPLKFPRRPLLNCRKRPPPSAVRCGRLLLARFSAKRRQARLTKPLPPRPPGEVKSLVLQSWLRVGMVSQSRTRSRIPLCGMPSRQGSRSRVPPARLSGR